ncbi:MAG TPA: class I SAM-dependent methyltransferase [Thermoplasmata archaeon]|nr:class I SAM-dependent methyltransferase [Thermoplasmata archaeon]
MPRTRARRNRPKARTARVGAPVNLRLWQRTAQEYEARHRRSLVREGGKAWGVFRIPERRLRLLGPVRGKRILELGCGAADWSIALSRAGARVVGLDFSEARLAQAEERVVRAGAPVFLVRARAEEIPFPGGYFDIVLSDYGATTFADPLRIVPEVARVLRPGGIFVFAHASPLRSLAEGGSPERLYRRFVRDYFGMRVLRFPESTEFQLPYGEWIRLFAACGLAVERLVEPRAPRTPQSTYFSAGDQRWGRRWPVEAIWRVTKRGFSEKGARDRDRGLGRYPRP